MISNRIVGLRCRLYRLRQSMSQSDVAKETGYTQVNISRFECGTNDNMQILLWYLDHGMSKKELLTGIPEEVERGREEYGD